MATAHNLKQLLIKETLLIHNTARKSILMNLLLLYISLTTNLIFYKSLRCVYLFYRILYIYSSHLYLLPINSPFQFYIYFILLCHHLLWFRHLYVIIVEHCYLVFLFFHISFHSSSC